jgi:cobalt-zinc-cadmium efflux system outer membrane protein
MPLMLQDGLAAEQSIWAPEPLAKLIAEGLENNQEIRSLESQVASLKEEISFAGALDDPRVGIGLANLPTDTFSFNQEPMTQKQIFVAQKFPWFGKLDLRSQRVALMAISKAAVLKTRRLELARQIANAYYQLGFTATSLNINDRLIVMVKQLLRVAETRYGTGKGLQQDVLQAQVELSKLLDDDITLRRKKRTLEDQLNGYLNREEFSPIKAPENLPYMNLKLNIKDLQIRVLKTNPTLEVRQAEIDKAGVEIELARKDYWPDMDFKVGYGQREEDLNGRNLPDFVSASVMINLPLWQNSRQDKKLAATKQSHEAALRSYRNLVLSLPHKVDALVDDIQNIQKNYHLIADALIVQAEQWARSSLSAYETGNVEFNTMINAQIRLLRFELQAQNYLFNLYKKRADLEEVLGEPI